MPSSYTHAAYMQTDVCLRYANDEELLAHNISLEISQLPIGLDHTAACERRQQHLSNKEAWNNLARTLWNQERQLLASQSTAVHSLRAQMISDASMSAFNVLKAASALPIRARPAKRPAPTTLDVRGYLNAPCYEVPRRPADTPAFAVPAPPAHAVVPRPIRDSPPAPALPAPAVPEVAVISDEAENLARQDVSSTRGPPKKQRLPRGTTMETVRET